MAIPTNDWIYTGSLIVATITVFMVGMTPSARPGRLTSSNFSHKHLSLRGRRSANPKACRNPNLAVNDFNITDMKRQSMRKPRFHYWHEARPWGNRVPDGREGEIPTVHTPFMYTKRSCGILTPDCVCRNHYDPEWDGNDVIQPYRGGRELFPHALPWLLFITTPRTYRCTGVMISYYHGLTAAHCLQGESHANVTMGAWDIRRLEEDRAITITVHWWDFNISPAYNNQTSRADVAVMKLSQGTMFDVLSIRFRPYIAPACMMTFVRPDLPHPRYYLPCFSAGWGKQFGDGEEAGPNRPLYLTFNIIREFAGIIDLRALQADRPAGPCMGDSGSPLMCQDVDGMVKVFGIIVTGQTGCDTRWRPARAASILDSLHWINITQRAYMARDNSTPYPPR